MLFEALERCEIDVALRSKLRTSRTLRREALFEEELVLVAPPGMDAAIRFPCPRRWTAIS